MGVGRWRPSSPRPIDDNGEFQTGFTAGATTTLVSGTLTKTQSSVGSPQGLGPAAGDPGLAVLNPDGGGATVGPSAGAAGRPVVEVRDALPDGGLQTGSLTAPISGPITTLNIGSAGGGSALVAFQQGASSTSQVVVDAVQALPHNFFAFTPFGWVRPTRAVVNWEVATSVIGAVTYSVVVDGAVKAGGLTALRYRLSPRGLPEGVLRVRVIATDSAGQETLTPVQTLKVDGVAPSVVVQRLSGRRVRVRVADAGSGAKPRLTSIAFGDRTAPVARRLIVAHRYAAPGRYLITVRCGDRAGNRAVHHVLVAVR